MIQTTMVSRQKVILRDQKNQSLKIKNRAIQEDSTGAPGLGGDVGLTFFRDFRIKDNP